MRTPQYLSAVTLVLALGGPLEAAQAARGEPQSTAKPTPQVLREWEKLSKTARQLAFDDRTADAAAMVQKFVARHPNLVDAQYLLASLFEQLAGVADRTPAQRTHLATAARHYERTLALATEPDLQFAMLWKLSRMHGPDDLSEPAVAERYARRMVDEHPARVHAYAVYAQLLHAKGAGGAAADVMLKGLAAAADMDVTGLMLSIQYSLEHVQNSPDLPRAEVQRLLEGGLAAADAMLARPDLDRSELRIATFAKAMGFELQARRLEQDRQRRIALLVEAERWGAPIEEFKDRAPPPPRTLTAVETTDLEWRALVRWTPTVVDAGRFAEAVATYEAFLAQHPKFHPPHLELAELHVRWARDGDAAARPQRLEQAAAHFRHVVELTPDSGERESAFRRLLELFGPAQLNRPLQAEAEARAMIKRQPSHPQGHYALATILLHAGRSAEGDKVLRGARAAIRATALSRAQMASELLGTLRMEPALAPALARKLFDEAGALLNEAEKLGKNDPDVLATRGNWWRINSARFESDPAKAKAMMEEAERLVRLSIAIREKGGIARADQPTLGVPIVACVLYSASAKPCRFAIAARR